MCTSNSPVTLQWLLDGIGQLPPPKLLLQGRRGMEELEPTNFCTYWPNNRAFDPKRMLLRRLFFINEYRTKYVCVGFYTARDYVLLVEFGGVRRGGVSKNSVSVMNKRKHRRRPLPRYGRTCVVAKRVLVVARARVVPSGWICQAVGERLVYTSIQSSFL